LKTRLELEHFSGKTVESLYQDFHAAVDLTGLESVLTLETNQVLNTKNTSINPQPVNHHVSCHAIKSEALNLLLSDIPIPKVLHQLRALFLTNPTLNKKKPSTPRHKKAIRRLLSYHRHQRQHCF
jgi:3-polyprenyl-4-hydroxybenzoate decarboxylase